MFKAEVKKIISIVLVQEISQRQNIGVSQNQKVRITAWVSIFLGKTGVRQLRIILYNDIEKNNCIKIKQACSW